MTFDGRVLTSLVMFAIFAGMSILAIGFPTKAGFMPLLVGIPGALLCFFQLIIDLTRDRQEETASSDDEPVPSPQDADPSANSEMAMFVWLGIFTVGLLGFGFVVGGPLLVFLYVRYCNKDPIQNALFAGAGTFAVLYGVFVWLLELTLFEGLILSALE